MNKSTKVIFHIDVDAFFVSAELTLRPELKDKDIAISTNHSNAIVSALSYSAKQKGAKVPMKLQEVKKYCPNIIVIKPNFDLYIHLSNKIYEYIKNKYTNLIEIGSIDEWYLDVTNIWKKYNNVIELAKHVQLDIKNKFDINVSIGISYNKFLAKISTDLNKPFGISITTKDQIAKHIWPLKIDNFIGIGKKTQQLLIKEGINTIGDLAKINVHELRFKKIFKNTINEYVNKANGISSDLIDLSKSNLKTIGNSLTFYGGITNDISSINSLLKNVAILVSQRLNERSLAANKISISITYSKYINDSLSATLEKSINTIDDIYNEALILFNKLWNGSAIKGIAIKTYSLHNVFSFQNSKSIFDISLNEKNKVQSIIESINALFKKKIIYTLKEYRENKTLSFSQSKYIK